MITFPVNGRSVQFEQISSQSVTIRNISMSDYEGMNAEQLYEEISSNWYPQILTSILNINKVAYILVKSTYPTYDLFPVVIDYDQVNVFMRLLVNPPKSRLNWKKEGF